MAVDRTALRRAYRPDENAIVEQRIANELGSTAQAGATEVAADAAFFAVQQERVMTLASGGAISPIRQTLEPTNQLATLTQIAAIQSWVPIIMRDEFV